MPRRVRDGDAVRGYVGTRRRRGTRPFPPEYGDRRAVRRETGGADGRSRGFWQSWTEEKSRGKLEHQAPSIVDIVTSRN